MWDNANNIVLFSAKDHHVCSVTLYQNDQAEVSALDALSARQVLMTR